MPGHTLQYYIDQKLFKDNNRFDLRKSLFDFLIKLKKSHLTIYDFHIANIMYDESKKQWSVIDGDANQKAKDDYDTLRFWHDGSKIYQRIIQRMIDIAERNGAYTQEEDALFLDEVTPRRKKKKHKKIF